MDAIKHFFFITGILILSSCASAPSQDRDMQADTRLGLAAPSEAAGGELYSRQRIDDAVRSKDRQMQRDITDPSAADGIGG